MKAKDFAHRAANLVSGDRNATHGDAKQNHANIAALWSAYLQSKYRRGCGVNVSAEDVAHMMALLKIARTMTGCFNADDWIDAVGYLLIAGELAHHDADLAGRIKAEHPT